MKPLGDFQRYLIEEFVEDWRHGEMSRREMVRRTVYITGGVASAADALRMRGLGYRLALIGTALMACEDPAQLLAEICDATRTVPL